MWRMYCVCLLSVIVVLDLLGQSHVNRNSLYGRTRRMAKPSTGIEPVTWRLQRDALPLCNPNGCLLLIGLQKLYSKQTDHPLAKTPSISMSPYTHTHNNPSTLTSDAKTR